MAPTKENTNSRRVWNKAREDAFIICLKEICSEGMKCDNAFKEGYLEVLANKMADRILMAKITATHVKSKIQVWKKINGLVLSMKAASGFGWNEETLSLSEIEDGVWENYFRNNPAVSSYRYPRFIYFNHWIEIFGKDRATGKMVVG